ncbi:ribose-5-phosphate isomerase B [Listeria monocytogenes]|nr:ribose-5-phosphate isomerase B [Listeria monocytogenes]
MEAAIIFIYLPPVPQAPPISRALYYVFHLQILPQATYQVRVTPDYRPEHVHQDKEHYYYYVASSSLLKKHLKQQQHEHLLFCWLP